MEPVKINFTIDYEKKIEKLNSDLTLIVGYSKISTNPDKYQIDARVLSRDPLTQELETQIKQIIPETYPYEKEEFPVRLEFSGLGKLLQQ